jgi:ATP-binding cassette subfamily F protein uup
MLACRDLSFAHEQRKLFVDASLSVDDGDRTALVGANGAGKSTLLAILAGELKPDGGTVDRGRGARVGMLAQEPRIDPNMKVVDVAREGLGDVVALIEEHTRLCAEIEQGGDADVLGARIATLGGQIDEKGGFDIEHRVETVLSRLGVTARESKVGELSGGGRRRLDLARLLLANPDILLLDEPTNHLDADAMRFLGEELAKHRGPVLFISHDRAFIDNVATRIVELDEGKIYSHPVPYDAFLESRLIRTDIMQRSQKRRERLYVRELAWLRAGTPARTTKQTARIDRAGELANEIEAEKHKLKERSVALQKARTERLGKTILAFEKLTIARGERVLFRDLDLILVEGERWGIVGPNGVGKTSLLAATLTQAKMAEPDEQLVPAAGKVILGQNTKIAVFDQHRAGLDPNATLEDTLSGQNDHVLVDNQRIHIATYLEKFLFDGRDRLRRVKTLSGGEQNRLVLARLFQKGANCLLLDEPTNDLDVSTLGVLEEALLDHAGVALIVSHDRRFLDRVCTGILACEREPDGSVKLVPYQGDYTNYERLKAQEAAKLLEKPVEKAADVDKADNRGARDKRKRSYKEEREFADIEKKVMAAETKRDDLRTKLNDGEVFRTNPDEGARLAAELAELEASIEKMYARWQELSDLAAS